MNSTGILSICIRQTKMNLVQKVLGIVNTVEPNTDLDQHIAERGHIILNLNGMWPRK